MKNKYKVCVYAIAKNEEKNLDVWVKSMNEADEIYVLDTGSTDNTVKEFKKRGVKVKVKNMNPFRFDEARNMSLDLVPDDCDICVCTDIDELLNIGWRAELENVWEKDMNQLYYKYTWFKDGNGNESVYYLGNIHKRFGFKWKHPVHEVLYQTEGEVKPRVYTDKVHLTHYKDLSKDRGQYLDLLELAVVENPYDDRDVFYLGREYMYYEKWDKCIKTLKKHLKLPTANWLEERSASMRFIGNAYKGKGDFKNAECWYFKAAAEAPNLREPYICLVDLYYSQKNWLGILHMAEKALNIKEKSKNYINEVRSWSGFPYDMASLAYYYVGLYKKSLDYCKKALEYDKNNKRLRTNLDIINNALYNKK